MRGTRARPRSGSIRLALSCTVAGDGLRFMAPVSVAPSRARSSPLRFLALVAARRSCQLAHTCRVVSRSPSRARRSPLRFLALVATRAYLPRRLALAVVCGCRTCCAGCLPRIGLVPPRLGRWPIATSPAALPNLGLGRPFRADRFRLSAQPHHPRPCAGDKLFSLSRASVLRSLRFGVASDPHVMCGRLLIRVPAHASEHTPAQPHTSM